ncbi:MAG TPA: hypothetical protein VIS51_10055 [Solirubrobacterales bacterium]
MALNGRRKNNVTKQLELCHKILSVDAQDVITPTDFRKTQSCAVELALLVQARERIRAVPKGRP